MKNLVVACPFCQSALPLREDRRGGRYFRCGFCLTASFVTGRDAIEKLEAGGVFTFTVRHVPDGTIAHERERGMRGRARGEKQLAVFPSDSAPAIIECTD